MDISTDIGLSINSLKPSITSPDTVSSGLEVIEVYRL